MWFTIGFAAACGLCAYVLPEDFRAAFLWSAVLLALLTGIPGRRFCAFRAGTLVLLGCALGLGWYGRYYDLYLDVPVSMDGRTETVTIRTTDYSYETDYGTGIDGIVSLDGKSYQVRAYLDEQPPMEPGQEITGPFRFRVTTPDGKEEGTYHSGKGIFLLAY